MSLLTRKKIIIAKIESVYATDSSPAGSNAILVRNPNLKPIAGSSVSRDLVRPYLGNSPSLRAEKFAQLDFEVELAGSGTVGLAPAYDYLLRACGFTKSTTLTTCTAACATTVVTVTKSSHGYSVGDKVVMTGFTDSPKNITATITGVTTNTFTYTAAGASDEISPAAGSPKINSAIVYAPISSSFESASIYFNVDGVQQKLLGSFGTAEFTTNVKQIPIIKFTFTGLYSALTDTGAVTPDFSAFMAPVIVNTSNTPGFSLMGYSGNMESCQINLAIDVQYITLVGSESVKILDRKPTGTLVFEAPTVASHNFVADVANATLGDMSISHGSLNGYKVIIDCPQVNLTDATFQDSNGVQMLNCPFTINPNTGNDEMTITVK